MTDDQPDPAELRRRLVRRAFWFGVALGFVCGALPESMRAACHAIASVCTGGNL